MEKILELGMQELKSKLGYDSMLSATDIGQEVIFFGGDKDSYSGCGVGISINKITLLSQIFDEEVDDNWKRLNAGEDIQVPAKYQ